MLPQIASAIWGDVFFGVALLPNFDKGNNHD